MVFMYCIYSLSRSKRYGFVLFDDTDAVEEVQKNRPHIINDISVQTVRSYPDDVCNILIQFTFIFRSFLHLKSLFFQGGVR